MTSIQADQATDKLTDKQFRRKAKKLRKKARSGAIYSLEQSLECAKYGVIVRAECDWGDELVKGQRPGLSPADLRLALLHILAGPSQATCPSWLRVQNGGLISTVVVVGLSGVDPHYMKENLSQLPFLQACNRPMPLRLYRGNHPRRSVYSLLFYSRKGKKSERDGRKGDTNGDGGDDDDDDDEQEDNGQEKNDDDGEGDEEEEEEGGLSVSVDEDATVSVDPAERYVMGLTQLRVSGFPLPLRGVSASEQDGGQGKNGAANDDGDAEHDDEDDGGDDDDLGCPVDQNGIVLNDNEGQKSQHAWLECDEKGVWGETQSLIPTLEEAKAILCNLDAIKMGAVSCCFYETLGGRSEEEEPPYRMAALDCEMCQTSEGMEVTRLTLVDDKKQVLLESYVKPYSPIVEYHTKYSGITPEIMEGCDTRIEQVQVALLRLVRADTILIGHSLEQDLMVTGLVHLRCIDTAIIFPHPRGPQCRFALRVLSKKYLNRVIQDSAAGHCSKEDAIAALDLVQLKVEHGPEFGVEGHARGEDTTGRDSFLDKLATYGKRCTLLDQSDTLVKVIRGQAAAIVCRSNDEAITKAKAQAKQAVAPHFMWVSLSGARPATLEGVEVRRKRRLQANNAGGSNNSPSSKRLKTETITNASGTTIGVASTSTTSTSSLGRHTKFTYEEHIMEMVDPELLRADQALAELYESLPANTLMMVLAQPDVILPTQMYHQRIAALHSRATLPWTKEHDEILNELSREAQKGVVLMRVR